MEFQRSSNMSGQSNYKCLLVTYLEVCKWTVKLVPSDWDSNIRLYVFPKIVKICNLIDLTSVKKEEFILVTIWLYGPIIKI